MRFAVSASDAAQLRFAALNALARREHSRAELYQKLASSGNTELLEQVLDHLQEQGLQSDLRFAESYCRSRIARGYGWLQIAQGLRGKGIGGELSNEVRHGLDVDWFALAVDAAVKRFGHKPCGDNREKARRIRFLQYRGFNGDQVRHALEALERDDDEA